MRGHGEAGHRFLRQYDIEAVTGASGLVARVLDDYLAGRLGGARPCRESTTHDHGRAQLREAGEKDEKTPDS